MAQAPDAEKKRIIDAFDDLGIRVADVKAYLGAEDLASLTPKDLLDLRAVYQAIKGGETNWREVMEQREAAPGKSKAGDPPPGAPATSRAPAVADSLQGGVRPPAKGASVAVPITGEAARPTFGSLVTPALQFTPLRFRRPAGSKDYVGAQGTCLIPGVGVFQRIVHRASTLICVFKRAPRVKPVLDFVKIAEEVFVREWAAGIKRVFQR